VHWNRNGSNPVTTLLYTLSSDGRLLWSLGGIVFGKGKLKRSGRKTYQSSADTLTSTNIA